MNNNQQMHRPLIPLYKVRSFGEKISDTFSFISENFRTLLKYITYFFLPLCLFQALAFNGLLGDYFSAVSQIMGKGGDVGNDMPFSSMSSLIAYALASVIFYTVGSALLFSLLYTLMRLYEQRDNRLRDVLFNEMWPLMTRNMKRAVVLILSGILLGVVLIAIVVLMALVTPVLAVVGYILVLVVLLPCSLAAPVYLFEELNVIDAFVKAFRLGFKTWGGIFGVMIVLTLIASVLQMITMLPWEFAMIFKGFFSLQNAEEGFTSSVGYSFLTYILGVIQCFGAYLTYTILFVGIAYQYGHACEKIDHVTVQDDIDHFENL